jgi:hypothetical protein
MAEKVLEPARVHALRGQGIAGRVPQHVDVNRERQPRGFAGMFNLARNTHAPERLAALIDEHIFGLDALGRLGAP